jgi:hypothetical protein
MADLRAKDVDPELIMRAHCSAALDKKTLRQFIIDAVRTAINEGEFRREEKRRAKRCTTKEKTNVK